MDITARKQKYVMSVYALLAFLSLFIFGILHIFVEKQATIGYFELAGAVAVVLSLVILKVSGRVAVTRACFLITIITMLIMMLVTGGTAGTGIFWFFMFPVAAFFLAGAREGVFWMLLLFTVLATTWLTGKADWLPVYYQDIEIRQLVAILIVVTIGIFTYQRYREQSEAEVINSKQKLQNNIKQTAVLHDKMDKAKSEFVALASHQLRTPISAIKWSSEMLLAGDAGKITEDQRDIVQGIEDSSQRLADIVDTMLLVSNLDLGKLEVQPEMTDLPALTGKVLAEQLKKLPEKQLEITESYENKLSKLWLDNRIMTIILRNIFSNAIKYTPSNGNIAVSIKHHKDKLHKNSKGSVLLEVADSGYGIPIDQQNDVFTKMFRATNVKAKDTDGTGLGLYTVKSLLERVGGKIWFESEEDKGTVILVLLPLEGMKSQDKEGHV